MTARHAPTTQLSLHHKTMSIKKTIIAALLILPMAAFATAGGNGNGNNGCGNGNGGPNGTKSCGGDGPVTPPSPGAPGTTHNGGQGGAGGSALAMQGQAQGQAQGQLQGQSQGQVANGGNAAAGALAGAAAGASSKSASTSGASSGSSSNASTGPVNASSSNTVGQQTSVSVSLSEAAQPAETSVKHSGTTTIKTAPDVYAPPSVTTAVCVIGASGGVSGLGWGVSLGGGIKDDGCEVRALASMLHTHGAPDAAKELLCAAEPRVAAAFAAVGKPCKAPAK